MRNARKRRAKRLMRKRRVSPGLQVVEYRNVGPHVSGGISYSGLVAIGQFPKVKK